MRYLDFQSTWNFKSSHIAMQVNPKYTSDKKFTLNCIFAFPFSDSESKHFSTRCLMLLVDVCDNGRFMDLFQERPLPCSFSSQSETWWVFVKRPELSRNVQSLHWHAAEIAFALGALPVVISWFSWYIPEWPQQSRLIGTVLGQMIATIRPGTQITYGGRLPTYPSFVLLYDA